MKKTAVLLVNLGTPEAPTESAVRTYLKEFLWDPRVVQIPRFIWWFILNGVVLRKRPALSAKAYQKVWMEDGSPLMVFSKRIQQSIQLLADKKSEGGYKFFLGMRYGEPSIVSQLRAIHDYAPDNIIFLPLYPQFATSSTGTAWHAYQREYVKWEDAPASKTIIDYHDDDVYIDALADSVREHWAENGKGDCLVISFHGVPERTIRQGDPYLSQCTKTTELLVEKLELESLEWRLVFQSRFGKAKWIQPYCVDVLKTLPDEDRTTVDVICPGFAADCLETLEEIAMENREVFLQAGGEAYRYIPALNDSEKHIKALFSLVEAKNALASAELLEAS
ncbi:MAG: ferrochelatase [Piscirickettsiaceae bacterium]|nr:MAG: ferrochelatase [Piscirickettsiaceae bacterium]PCI71005.1 MAG: ferrochelatase [Piscirickettsiaceae bacterium]